MYTILSFNHDIFFNCSYSSKYNLKFSGKDVDDAIIEEMHFYKKSGGGTIVENTSIGLHRNVPLMVKAQKETGVNIISGTGKLYFE